ncbi:hypothetical protein H4W81_004692 [Nonomuraea africana]|uniref:MFS transporter n=1 Tax=Nonomuraea africana TaxID=46171 RepID=A0ABR9KJV7_9ACTN|nr:hypothetical protein [Nonomuraea africana]
MVSAVIAGFCLLTVACMLALKETSRADLMGELVPDA